jgi:uncharacterized protein YbjT (DUF2867 family)
MNNKQVLIFGATGNIGGAAARELLRRGWDVRAVTRNPKSEQATALMALGAQVVQADMEQRDTLEAAFDGMRRVFNVQNWTTSGVEGEIRQGKLVSEVAKSANIEHLVYGSAGTGEENTGIPHFQSKLEVEGHMRKLGIPFTILRPGPFMELLSEKEFYPAMGTWGTQPKVTGWEMPLPWTAVHDLGVAIANIFENPDRWLGCDLTLFSDVKSLAECRAIFTAIDGKKPLGIPLPMGLFRRMAGDEFVKMWEWEVEWIKEKGPKWLCEIIDSSRELCPELLDLESWLRMKRNGAAV